MHRQESEAAREGGHMAEAKVGSLSWPVRMGQVLRGNVRPFQDEARWGPGNADAQLRVDKKVVVAAAIVGAFLARNAPVVREVQCECCPSRS